ncbi:MAG TPA: Fur family transcriptional regulator [Syntrophomonadaceae bacterium]|nr:Fur family transcriptional regulator [Syntrophomonadaceae bacterium]
MDNESIGKFLQMHDIKPSHHRIRVFQYLAENKNHPTVDGIYRELKPEIPTLSKTTLYNTLSLFVDKKIVSLITIEENETRYDADTSLHGHFKCHRCGKVYDIRLHLSSLNFAELDDFEVYESQVYFQGICPLCQKVNQSKP